MIVAVGEGTIYPSRKVAIQKGSAVYGKKKADIII